MQSTLVYTSLYTSLAIHSGKHLTNTASSYAAPLEIASSAELPLDYEFLCIDSGSRAELHGDSIILSKTPKVVALSAVSWLMLYHFRTLTTKVYRRLVKPDHNDGADHACHLAGSVAGLVAAAIVVRGNPLPEGTCSKVAIGASLAYVFAQFWGQKQ